MIELAIFAQVYDQLKITKIQKKSTIMTNFQ